jgi:aromatic ring-opening dioxygenase LigB subunit
MSGSVCCSVLMCHAAVVLPEVGGEIVRECSTTTWAMIQLSELLVEHAPDVVIILSPYAPRHPGSFGIARDAVVAGDFSEFGAPQLTVELPAARAAGAAIAAQAKRFGVRCQLRRLGLADHGTLVPLHFLARAGWRGPTLRMALPYYPDVRTCEAMGRAVAAAAAESGQRWAFVASGDMSHRLQPGAPASFHPRAREFDDAVVQAVREGHYRRAVSVDPGLRQLAAEDVIDTLAVAVAATGFCAQGRAVLSYESPFGVGYLVAMLADADPGPAAPAGALEDRASPRTVQAQATHRG